MGSFQQLWESIWEKRVGWLLEVEIPSNLTRKKQKNKTEQARQQMRMVLIYTYKVTTWLYVEMVEHLSRLSVFCPDYQALVESANNAQDHTEFPKSCWLVLQFKSCCFYSIVQYHMIWFLLFYIELLAFMR